MAERRAGNLAAEMTSFVGRADEVMAGVRLLEEARLLTVVGPAGVGKSRLALRVAEASRRRYPDGLWHVDLSPVRHAAPAVPPTVRTSQSTAVPDRRKPLPGYAGPADGVAVPGWGAGLLHSAAGGGSAVPERREPTPQLTGGGGAVLERELVAAVARVVGAGMAIRSADGLAEVLRGRRALIVLDTCEHVLAPAALLAEALARHAPHVRVLATGRRPLRVAHERVLRLPPLPLPGPSSPDPDCASVALFAERAVAFDPDFSLTPQVREAVAEICRRLDGLPLAIELAAARTRSLSTGELLARLGDMFTLPAVPGEAAQPRHRDLRSAVAWSHELCDAGQRALWRSLATIEGDFDLETAERVAAEEPGRSAAAGGVGETLAGMVESSIVLAEGNRYRMLETYRRYGLDLRGGAPVPRRSPVEVYGRAPSPSAPGAVRIGRPVTDALTARELQIAELIAEGLSNPRIAAHLVIAKRTVDAHVRNILAKGGLVSRTQVATWFAERHHWADV